MRRREMETSQEMKDGNSGETAQHEVGENQAQRRRGLRGLIGEGWNKKDMN